MCAIIALPPGHGGFASKKPGEPPRYGHLDDCCEMLRGAFKLVRHAFRWYAARGTGTFSIRQAGFYAMAKDMNVVDKAQLRAADLDRIFIAVNAARGGVAHSTADVNSAKARVCVWVLERTRSRGR